MADTSEKSFSNCKRNTFFRCISSHYVYVIVNYVYSLFWSIRIINHNSRQQMSNYFNCSKYSDLPIDPTIYYMSNTI